MFNFFGPIQIYKCVGLQRSATMICICEWQSDMPEPSLSGVFLVATRHILGATQTTRKILRDDLAHARKATFEIRPASPFEVRQLKYMPNVAGREFAEVTSAGSKAKPG